MLVCLVGSRGGLNVTLDGKFAFKLTGGGVIDKVDESLYKKAKEKYAFFKKWEKDGTIVINDEKEKKAESIEKEKAEQAKTKSKNKD